MEWNNNLFFVYYCLRFVTGDYTLRNVTSPFVTGTFPWNGQSLLGHVNYVMLPYYMYSETCFLALQMHLLCHTLKGLNVLDWFAITVYCGVLM